VWGHEDEPRPDAPFLCAVSEGDKSLWVLGVPAPADVHGLLERHAGIAVPIDLGIGAYVLDLQTGEILVERETQKLLADPKQATRERVAREALAAHDIRGAYRELSKRGWQDYSDLGGYCVARMQDDDDRGFEVTATACVSEDYQTLLLSLAGYYLDSVWPVKVLERRGEAGRDLLVGDWEITEQYGRGKIVIALDSWNFDRVPTPREAARLLNGRGDA